MYKRQGLEAGRRGGYFQHAFFIPGSHDGGCQPIVQGTFRSDVRFIDVYKRQVMEWDKDSIKLMMDDKLVKSIDLNTTNYANGAGNPFRTPFYLIPVSYTHLFVAFFIARIAWAWTRFLFGGRFAGGRRPVSYTHLIRCRMPLL